MSSLRFVSCLVCLSLLAWLGDGCAAPVIWPSWWCDGALCATSGESSTPKETLVDADGGADSSEVAPEPVAEGPDGQERSDGRESSPGDSRPWDTSLELSPEEPATEPPPERPETRPDVVVDTKPKCIDKDGDRVCANKITPTYKVDCDDTDPLAKPGAKTFRYAPRKGGGWDFDCSGKVERRYEVAVCYQVSPLVCKIKTAGLATNVNCGELSYWSTVCVLSGRTCVPVANGGGRRQGCY